MKRLIRYTALMCVVLPALALALTRDDLSEEAKKLVPDESVTVVTLKNGQQHEGTLLADTLDVVSIREVIGGASTVLTYPREQVVSVAGKDITPVLAGNLLKRFVIDQRLRPDRDECKLAISLLDEFLAHSKDAKEAPEVAGRRRAFKRELDELEAGMSKVDESVMSQTLNAIAQYESDGVAMKTLVQQFPGIDQPTFAGDAEAKLKYDAARERKSTILKKLPETLKSSVTQNLKQKDFAAAAKELDVFLKLWVNKVIPEEAQRRGADPKTVSRDMNLRFIIDLQIKFMKTYVDAGMGQAALPKSYLMPKDMVYIPGGYFLMGREEAAYGESDFPLHLVYVEAFLVDRYEVKNRDYNAFVAHVTRTGDASYEHPLAPALKDHTSQGSKNPAFSGDDQPVVGIDWMDAYAYARWKGKRLPTEAEWEKASRGPRMRKYPWGIVEPSAMVVNSAEGRSFLAGEMTRQNPPPPPKKGILETVGVKKAPPARAISLPQATWPVAELWPAEALAAQKAGNFKWTGLAAVSPYSLFHIGGNAAEWVSDWYDPAYYPLAPMVNPQGPEGGTAHAYRGGSYLSPAQELLTTWRAGAAGDKLSIGCSPAGEPMIGFRCVKVVGEISKW
ncbi:MAG: SUMF1/EgtB/PvdO family nonheme iron enzyme [bacterium]